METNTENSTDLKQGDKVKTRYGDIETVLSVESRRVITYESIIGNRWYHPSKVWKVQ
jgi:hypothetical protein